MDNGAYSDYSTDSYARSQVSALNEEFSLLKEVVQNQKEKLCHMSFSINRAEAFIDFLLSSTKLIPTPEEVREINQVAVERTNVQFPSMPIQLILDEDKAPEEDMYRSYYMQHKLCPVCKSTDHKQTLLGFHFESLETAKDENQSTCLDCGWVGIVHDLLAPEPEQKNDD